MSRQRGQSALYAVLMMPLLLLVLALVADVGALQIERVRLRWAQDMSLVDAVTEVDADRYANTGELRIAGGATSVYRNYLVANLASLQGVMADGATPGSVADGAEVAIVNQVPGTDPFTGQRLDRPAICARIRVPVRTALLHLAGLGSSQQLTITGSAVMGGEP